VAGPGGGLVTFGWAAVDARNLTAKQESEAKAGFPVALAFDVVFRRGRCIRSVPAGAKVDPRVCCNVHEIVTVDGLTHLMTYEEFGPVGS
jgi:hypothetical protein